MRKSSQSVNAEVHFKVAGLKDEFLKELRRRARFKGNRGKIYRKLLKAIV